VSPVWNICTVCEPDLAYFLACFGIILSLVWHICEPALACSAHRPYHSNVLPVSSLDGNIIDHMPVVAAWVHPVRLGVGG